jgi:uncharacterized protein YggU (UPF0235/DUF167 family)
VDAVVIVRGTTGRLKLLRIAGASADAVSRLGAAPVREEKPTRGNDEP